jgi:GNAT superfamily N-acetyltransferase
VSPQEHAACVRVMTRSEAQVLQSWLIGEQWDEGDYDADVLYDIDPEGFWAILDDDGEVAGGLSIIASTDSVATISHFYIKPEARGRGYARRALPRLLEIHGHRIHDDVAITNFCWPHAVEDSARWGFAPLHQEIRMVRAAGRVAVPIDDPLVVDARTLDPRSIISFDETLSGRPREVLWRRWLDLPGSASLALVEGNGHVIGLGAIRPSALGYRVGPLMAMSPQDARRLLERLLPYAGGQRVAVDVPTANPGAEPLARDFDFVEDFRTVRTVWGRAPEIPWRGIYATVMLHLD